MRAGRAIGRLQQVSDPQGQRRFRHNFVSRVRCGEVYHADPVIPSCLRLLPIFEPRTRSTCSRCWPKHVRTHLSAMYETLSGKQLAPIYSLIDSTNPRYRSHLDYSLMAMQFRLPLCKLYDGARSQNVMLNFDYKSRLRNEVVSLSDHGCY